METVLRELKKVLREDQIREQEPLSRHTTFRVGGPADLFLTPDSTQISDVMQILKAHQVSATVIGKGSNLLVGDKGIRGAVIEFGKQIAQIHVEGSKIMAEAGAALAAVAQQAYKAGLADMEFAAGIPGSVGGALVMNAGAYGGEMKDIVESVKVLSKDGKIMELSNEQMDFSYRHSCVTEQEYLVLSAVLKLQQEEPEKILARMEQLREQRVSKQPLEYPSAGSTFKRPEGYFAGKLIMDAGLADYTIGGAAVSKKHCGFVINKGGATAADILALIKRVQQVVKEQSGVELEPEVKLIGEF
ncbi:UDP-N-acetylmuramate dehydrogenase [Roseburia zhanii]|uniref:UDP-N-acetylmuramate dehydrogenase n=1 Tax=Roseburia zhanii TaxID=2763064 RepID=UPI002ED16D30